MPWQPFITSGLAFIGWLACLGDFEHLSKRIIIWGSLGSVAGGLIIGSAAMVLRNLP